MLFAFVMLDLSFFGTSQETG